MKILLIYPTITIYGSDTTTPQVRPPLGLLYIAAVCEQHGHRVKILDCIAEGINEKRRQEDGAVRFGLDNVKVLASVEEFVPDIVAVSAMYTAFSKDAHDIARTVKLRYKNLPIVFGGMHASTLPHDVLKDKNVDFVVIGEGEETSIELFNAINTNQSYKKVKGIAYRNENGKTVLTGPRPRIRKLDDLPLPARHLIDINHYSRIAENEPDNYIMRHPYTVTHTSRGCPYNCVYCAAHNIWCNRWIARSPKNVVDEIEYLVKTYGTREIHFLDDNVSVDKSRFEGICNQIIERKLDITWTCPTGIAIWTLNEETLKLMKKSGCYKLCLGIESGHPQTLRFIRKKLDLERTKELIKYAAKLAYWLHATYIIGFPYETSKQIEATIDYASSTYCDFINFLLLIPYPGTEVFDILSKENLLTKQQFSYENLGYMMSGFHTVIGNKYLSAQELNQYYDNAFRKMLLVRIKRVLTKPLLFLGKIYDYDSLKFFIRILFNSIGVMKVIFWKKVTETGSLKPHYTGEFIKR